MAYTKEEIEEIANDLGMVEQYPPSTNDWLMRNCYGNKSYFEVIRDAPDRVGIMHFESPADALDWLEKQKKAFEAKHAAEFLNKMSRKAMTEEYIKQYVTNVADFLQGDEEYAFDEYADCYPGDELPGHKCDELFSAMEKVDEPETLRGPAGKLIK